VPIAVLATLLFWGAVAGFAAWRPDYRHATKAVSELGVIGAPRMWAFNLLGYIIPGALTAGLGWRIGRAEGRTWIAVFLSLSGLGMSLAGVFPADMHDFARTTTQLHIVGLSLGLTWIVAVIALAFGGRNRRLARLSGAAAATFIATFALYGFPDAFPYPGLVQRLTFAIWFAWFLFAARLVSAADPTTSASSVRASG
jgi:hypothetical membrane protein